MDATATVSRTTASQTSWRRVPDKALRASLAVEDVARCAAALALHVGLELAVVDERSAWLRCPATGRHIVRLVEQATTEGSPARVARVAFGLTTRAAFLGAVSDAVRCGARLLRAVTELEAEAVHLDLGVELELAIVHRRHGSREDRWHLPTPIAVDVRRYLGHRRVDEPEVVLDHVHLRTADLDPTIAAIVECGHWDTVRRNDRVALVGHREAGPCFVVTETAGSSAGATLAAAARW